MLTWIRDWARRIKRDVHALYLAARDPRTPWCAKALALGIALAVRLVPPDVMAERRAAAASAEGRPTSRVGAAIVVAVWLSSAGLLLRWPWPTATW